MANYCRAVTKSPRGTVVYSIIRRSSDWAVLDGVDRSAFKSGCPVKAEEFWLIWRGGPPKIIVIYVSHFRIL